MSEKLLKFSGFILIILAVAFVVSAQFPAKHADSFAFASQNLEKPETSGLPYIDPDDPVNKGSIQELAELPGVGEKTAVLIMEEREMNGRFVYPEDILSVKGIGEKKLEKIRPLLHLLNENPESEE